ncbi:YaaC family protein [Paracoccus sp. (in: a-proteobacteria)]|uniref:YaaC family protein n=1 Tax=Paracoccus sp. TaxID=267 RepID=UPI002AFFD900|nr:YaaC family protein [Paracoccus sp. (in: a-proteobacteria)]
MAHELIVIDRKPLQLRRAVISPAWKDEKVLTSDVWTYVDLWMRRNAKGSDAQFYWQQSREFYRASQGLPITASPLTLYYCFLNATKALLASKKIKFLDLHGVTGHKTASKASLSNERVVFKSGGVLPALISYYGDAQNGNYTLKELLGNMSFVHRAYCLSYSEPYHFFSIFDPVYAKARGSSEAWVSFEMEPRFNDRRVLATLPPGYQKNPTFSDVLVIRRKKRFKWKSGPAERGANLTRLTEYHKKLRRNLTYVSGADRWYLKRRHSNLVSVDRHTPTLIFAAMHRLSELSRYDPIRLSRILDTQRNWILAEFVKSSPTQFLDEIACEITGQEIYAPGIHGGSSLSLS